MTRPPAYQVYATDQRARIVGLSLLAVGGIYSLELAMWVQSTDQCSIADDDERIARIVGLPLDEWKVLRAEIQHAAQPIFEEKDGRLISPYLRQEASKQRKYRKLQAEKSKKGVEARMTRGLTGGSPTGEARVTFPIPIPIPSPIPIPVSKEEEKRGPGNAHSQTNDASSSSVKRNRKSLPVDEAFLNELRANPAYSDILDIVLNKLKGWLLGKGKGKKLTRRRLIDWLNREQRPLQLINGSHGGIHHVERIADKDFRKGWQRPV